MRPTIRPLLCLYTLAAVAAAGAWAWEKRKPAPGPYEKLALSLNGAKAAEVCDRTGAERRLRLARVLDKFHPRIGSLWEQRAAKDFPEQHLEQVGPIFVRLREETRRAEGFDVSSWSWEEAQALFLRTQSDPEDPETRGRWRDLDTSLRFLLEKDVARLLKGRSFLPPAETPHRFWPNRSVVRSGPREFTVRLNAGDFTGAEEKLRLLLEKEWSTEKRRLKVLFTKEPGFYTMRANFRSARSFVNHRTRTMVIANYAWSRTVAHELGHILGFDDHYYSVWHKEHCYYTQESRVGDLMSNSEKGRVGAEHWRVLERAYPWPVPTPAFGEAFTYFFGGAAKP